MTAMSWGFLLSDAIHHSFKNIMTKTTASIKDGDNQGGNGSFLLLRAATAKKLGKQSDGGIDYQILGNTDRTSLHLTITANSSGGYFSREIVPFKRIETCLGMLEKEKPFSSKSLKEAFVGRSSNNAGFMVAILRNEGLLTAAPEAESQHLISGDWASWQASQLALPGEPLEFLPPASSSGPKPLASESDAASSEMKSKTLTLKRPKPGNL